MLKFNNSGIRMTDCLSASKKPHLPEISSPSSRQNKSIPKINHLNTKKTKKEKNQTFLRFFLAFFAIKTIKMIYLWNWLKKSRKIAVQKKPPAPPFLIFLAEKTTCRKLSKQRGFDEASSVQAAEMNLLEFDSSTGAFELSFDFFQLLLWQRLLWRVWVRLQRGL